jgi:hypothetical protein
MKISRCLYFVALIFGLSSLANASNIDFHMTVLDGPITGDYITDGSPFQVSFGACPTMNPDLSAYSACFYGINDTGGTITSLDLTFNNTTGPVGLNYLNGQDPDCAPSNFFDNVNSPCYLNGAANDPTSTYILDFSGGTGIPPSGLDSSFYIAVQGANPQAFQGGMGTVTYTGETPEPSSIVLLATGIGMLGMFFVSRRRVQGQASRL